MMVRFYLLLLSLQHPIVVRSYVIPHSAARSGGVMPTPFASRITTDHYPCTTRLDYSPSSSNGDYNLLEKSRRARRDVFNYDLWVEKRSRKNFFSDNLRSIFFESLVVRQLFPDYMFVTGTAVFICLYNGVLVTGLEGSDPIGSFWPLMALPADFFRLTTPFLALLLGTCIFYVSMMLVYSIISLVFKINTSYKRWDEGRKNWGSIINSSRTILREGAAWIQEEQQLSDNEQHLLMQRLEQAVWAFSRSLTRHLLSAEEDDDAYAVDCLAKVRPELAHDLIAARHKPNRALYELSAAINEFSIDERRRISMDHSVTVLCDSMGSSERIFTSPVPKFYSRHAARFTEFWLFCVPFGLYGPFASTWNHWGMIPASFVIAFFILTIEELSVQLEEPFTVLPQHAITENSIGKVLTETVQWRQTDYDRMLEAYHNGRLAD